jgi:hypothetical protein
MNAELERAIAECFESNDPGRAWGRMYVAICEYVDDCRAAGLSLHSTNETIHTLALRALTPRMLSTGSVHAAKDLMEEVSRICLEEYQRPSAAARWVGDGASESPGPAPPA